jgi:hypothetical protein
MTLAAALKAIHKSFLNLEDSEAREVLRAVIRRDELRVTDYAGDTYSVMDDWTPERLNEAIASTVALFNHNMHPHDAKPAPKLKRVK